MLYVKMIRRIYLVPARIMFNFLLIIVLFISSTLMLKVEDELFSNDLYAFAPADTDTVVNYYPMHVGDYHIFETRYSGFDPPWYDTMSVFDTISINSSFYHQVDSYWSRLLNLRMDDIGDIYLYSVNDSQDVLLYKFHSALGDSYRVDSLYGGWSFDVIVSGVNKTTETLAGTFNDCITLFFDSPQVTEDAVDIWFAPSVGIVRIDGPWHLQSILKSAKVDTVLFGNEAPMITFPDTLFMNYDKADTLILSDYVYDRETPDSLLDWDQLLCLGDDSLLCVFTNVDTAFFFPLNFLGVTSVEFKVFDPAGASDTASIVVKVAGPIGIEQIESNIPEKYSLSQNFPNPFNPVTNISYSLPRSGDVTLIIYNLLGEEVIRLVDGFQPAGEYQTGWNAFNASSGIYFYRLQSGGFTETKKMVVLK